MDAAFVPDECYRNQNEHSDKHDALFVFREFENAEQTFHLSVAQLPCLRSSRTWSLLIPIPQSVILSEAKNLGSLCTRSPNQ